MLRAIGINPVAPRSNSAMLPLDLGEMKRLIAAGIKVDGVRDRHGSTALGVAAQLGRVEAMKLLIEAGAHLDAANLDDATPLSLAVFGKAANAVAMLLVYGGESVDYADALADAHATGAHEVVDVFSAWEQDEEHDLIEQAEEYHSASLPILEKLKGGSSVGSGGGGATAGSASSSDVAAAIVRAEAAENQLAFLADELRELKDACAEWERRALKAEAALAQISMRNSGDGHKSHGGGSSLFRARTGKQLVGSRHDVTDSASDVVDGPNAHRNRGRMPHFLGQEPNARASFMSRTFVSKTPKRANFADVPEDPDRPPSNRTPLSRMSRMFGSQKSLVPPPTVADGGHSTPSPTQLMTKPPKQTDVTV